MSISSALKERVRIEQMMGSDDGYGGQTLSWATLTTVFAQVEPVYSVQGEGERAEQRLSNAGYRVKIRQRSDVNAAMRIIWKSRTLLIHSIHEQGELLSLLTYEEHV